MVILKRNNHVKFTLSQVGLVVLKLHNGKVEVSLTKIISQGFG